MEVHEKEGVVTAHDGSDKNSQSATTTVQSQSLSLQRGRKLRVGLPPTLVQL